MEPSYEVETLLVTSVDDSVNQSMQPFLVFEITSDDGFIVETRSIENAWKILIERVLESRKRHCMKQVSFAGKCLQSLFLIIVLL